MAQLVLSASEVHIRFGVFGNGGGQTYSKSIKLSVMTLHQVRLDMLQSAPGASNGGLVGYIDGHKAASLLSIADDDLSLPDYATFGLIPATPCKAAVRLYLSHVRFSCAPLLDYSTRYNGSLPVGTQVLNIVNGIVTSVVGSGTKLPTPGSGDFMPTEPDHENAAPPEMTVSLTAKDLSELQGLLKLLRVARWVAALFIVVVPLVGAAALWHLR